MDSPPLDPSDPDPSEAPATPRVGRPDGVPTWAYGVLAAVLLLPALIWAVGALVLSASVEW